MSSLAKFNKSYTNSSSYGSRPATAKNYGPHGVKKVTVSSNIV